MGLTKIVQDGKIVQWRDGLMKIVQNGEVAWADEDRTRLRDGMGLMKILQDCEMAWA